MTPEKKYRISDVIPSRHASCEHWSSVTALTNAIEWIKRDDTRLEDIRIEVFQVMPPGHEFENKLSNWAVTTALPFVHKEVSQVTTTYRTWRRASIEQLQREMVAIQEYIVADTRLNETVKKRLDNASDTLSERFAQVEQKVRTLWLYMMDDTQQEECPGCTKPRPKGANYCPSCGDFKA